MPSPRVPNKVCLVTGGASGIGRAAAELLAKEGALVIVSDTDLEAATSVIEKIASKGGQAEAVVLDVAQESSWQEAIDVILAYNNRLDVLVNSAGLSDVVPTSDCSFERWRKVMRVNLDGVFLGMKHALAAMTEGGSIVNVASVSGITPGGGAAAYCSSKAAVRMLSKSVAIECADRGTGIRVNLVTPGGVRTPMWEKQEFFQTMVAEQGGVEEAFASMEGEELSNKFFTPKEVAQTILYFASDESSHLTGAEIVLDRGHTL